MAQHVQVSVRPGGYAVVTMCKEPVNTMDLDMYQALLDALTQLEERVDVNAVIFASGVKRAVFTAGNDVMRELYAPNTSQQRYTRFWEVSNEFLVRLHSSRLFTVAAIRGACPAGGCALSLCCDARLMTRQGQIGLNEVALGIPVPKYWALLMGRTIGIKRAEELLLSATLLDAAHAQRGGLVDEVVDSQADLLPKAEALVLSQAKLSATARAATKLSIRGEFCEQWRAFYKQEPATSWPMLASPQVVAALKKYIEALSKPKAKL